MLVLSRREQEQIRIGKDIVITIIRVKGDTVRVGVEAPKDVRVMREEINVRTNYYGKDRPPCKTV